MIGDDPSHAAVRRALGRLWSDDDPVADLAAGADDLRPWGVDALDRVACGADRVLVSGPDDLAELRRCVATVCGPESWPAPPAGPPRGWRVLERRRCAPVAVTPAAVGALVRSLGPWVDDRVAQWRTWPTAVEAVMAAWEGRGTLSVDVMLVERQR